MNKNSINSIKSLAKQTKKNRINRVYYKHGFTPKPLNQLGVLRANEKNIFDLVVLDQNTNEQFRYYGLNKLGSFFEIIVNISSLYPDVQRPNQESLLRHGSVKFVYEDRQNGWKYIYEHEELIDYQKKRTASDYESTNVYKLGSICIDVSIPFALTRISFNGNLKRRKIASESQSKSGYDFVAAKLNISTHPTCDKFDYSYMFSSKFLAETIHKSTSQMNEASKLIRLALEDRIDQTFMFRCELELLDEASKHRDMFWGAKSRRFVEPRLKLARKSVSQPLESLFMWSELGTIVHLRRPVGHPNLIYGMINCGFDYASHLYGASCMVPDSAIETDFGRLASFSNIPKGTKMVVTGYKSKNIEIIINEEPDNSKGPIPITIDGFAGLLLCRNENPGEIINDVQSKLLAVDIHDRQITYRLSSEALLGGKGSSLVGLSFLTSDKNQSGVDMANLIDPNRSLSCLGAKVPRGVVVTCLAYQLWLESNPIIASSIRDLDNTRKALAAKSFYVNPLSDKHLTMAQHQAVLREQCHKTNLLLNSCPLPAQLERQLYVQLASVFGESSLIDYSTQETSDHNETRNRKLFAVRSSAMGEDSMETSAAGQMKTFLDVQGFQSICRAIVACWASQFQLEAVTYKSQNSMLFNWPMAVVVQELIHCDVAGVAATCNPIDGRSNQLEITANRGLGEGVVSGKQTDTVRVSLDGQLDWDPLTETHIGPLKSGAISADCLQKVIGSENGLCCLDDKQIVALTNLLIWLRGRYQTKEREIEWGITADHDGICFDVHLLQSRPLTNLTRANNAIIAHELDSGSSSPYDILTRANLGEVMPGCISPLFTSHFLQTTMALAREKPYSNNHTIEYFCTNTFNVTAQIVTISLTNSESINRMKDVSREVQQGIQYMIGYQENEDYTQEIVDRFRKVRLNPECKKRNDIVRMFMNDLGLIEAKNLLLNRTLNRKTFMENLTSIDDLICQIESSHQNALKRASTSTSILALNSNNATSGESSGQHNNNNNNSSSSNSSNNSNINDNDHGNINSQSIAIVNTKNGKRILSKGSAATSASNNKLNGQQLMDSFGSLELRKDCSDELSQLIRDHTKQLFRRLCVEINLIEDAWLNHMRGTVLSMGFNTMCIYSMQQQDAYKQIEDEDERKKVILNDFSVLIRDSNKDKTESGDISVVLDRIVNCLASEGRLAEVKKMSTPELFNHLNDLNNKSDSALKFREFLKQNGHRTFKEFDYGNLTWFDDPSFVIKSLAVRLKQHTLATPTNSQTQTQAKSREEISQEVNEILAKITTKRRMLINFALPRAKRAVAKRENTKSSLIRTVDLYRKGFRSLGALLCLDGRLPEVSLIYYLSLNELNTIVTASDEHRSDLSRLVYKARRRQQVFRSLESHSLPEITLNVLRENASIDDALDGKKQQQQQQQQPTTTTAISHDDIKSDIIVRGMTSCNGLVTGRACVVNNLDEIDQVQANDILITYSIDVSWTVYFFTIAGIVTEVGGIVSHGAVVAREYGIPTLCMAANACSKFKTGQIVTLDANKAICYLAEQTASDAKQFDN